MWAINISIIDPLSVIVAVVRPSRSTKKCLLHFLAFGGVSVYGPYRLRPWDWAVRYGKHNLQHRTVHNTMLHNNVITGLSKLTLLL